MESCALRSPRARPRLLKWGRARAEARYRFAAPMQRLLFAIVLSTVALAFPLACGSRSEVASSEISGAIDASRTRLDASTTVDAGTSVSDGGAHDAAVEDTSSLDSGSVDAEAADTGPDDAGDGDAGEDVPGEDAGTGSVTFSYTGAEQSFVVPYGVRSLAVTASGAIGGDSHCLGPGLGGLGATATATIPVTPGETLFIVVGGQGGLCTEEGPGGFNGGGGSGATGPYTPGGGGGASDVRQGGAALNNRVVVAGGGGGAGGGNGGVGGDPLAETGLQKMAIRAAGVARRRRRAGPARRARRTERLAWAAKAVSVVVVVVATTGEAAVLEAGEAAARRMWNRRRPAFPSRRVCGRSTGKSF